jgi:hypothetical protein
MQKQFDFSEEFFSNKIAFLDIGAIFLMIFWTLTLQIGSVFVCLYGPLLERKRIKLLDLFLGCDYVLISLNFIARDW